MRCVFSTKMAENIFVGGIIWKLYARKVGRFEQFYGTLAGFRK